FQQLGLDSLLLTQASFALRERFGVKVTMRQLIEDFPTFEKLAAHLAGAPGLHRPAAAPAGDLAAPAGDGDLVLPLTEAQKEIWYVSQLGPALSAAYNESSTLLLRGSLDRAALDRAIEDVRRRHESLRITIDPAGERQRITATGTPATAQWEDLSDTPAEGADRRLLERINDLCGQPFDLAAGPLWRVHVFQLAPDRHALVLVVHHIICDGWSQAVVLQDLGECYTARRQGTEPSLAPAPRFSEYARTEAAQLDSPPRAAAAQFWTERFADGAPVLEFPGDRPRPAVRTYAASHLHRRLQPETVAALRQLVTNQHSTPFTVLLAAYVTILHRMSGQDDVVVGVPAAPQVLAGLPGLVGHCVNLLPLRSRLDAAQDFASYLQATRQASLDAFEHWSHPFARLLRLLNLPRAANRVPLANVTFNLGRHRGTPRFADLVVESAGNPKRFVNFDLSFNLTEVADGFVVDCHYSTELFDADTIARLLARYEVVLQAAAAEPQRLVIRLPLLTPAERHQTVVEWNDNAVAWRRDQCLHELFEEQAARAPDATALIWGTERWSYRRLNELANQIAHRLRRLGVNREMPVGIHAGRTPDTVAALFGILKSGGAYVPLDPVYPADRIAYMLDDSRATLLVTDRRRVGDPPPATAAVRLDLLEDRAAVAREPVTNPERRARPEDLAYVIYTSGSTGRPKGVAIEHRNGVALANWARDVFPPQELAGVLAGTSFSFDLSIFEIFVTLGLGGTAILAENPLELGTIPARGQVTLVNSVPSVVAELLRLDLFSPSVHTVFMAGEALPDSLADRLLAVPHLKKVYEGYGPSETTTFTSCGLRQPGVRSNLGRPFPNTQYYVLDRHLELVPPGVPGEICIGGENVARGYLNQPALTREKFVPNPFSAVPGARLYRSGDLARQRPDGLLEFVGRVDHQVKIRGFRVEPGEIESVILRDPVLRQCVVVVVEPAPGDRRLAAYVVPVAGATAPGADRIRAAVAAALPDYMVPSFVVPLAELPLTGNGKVDRRALPAPVATTPAAAAAAAPAAPRSLTEQMLAEIWNDVLGRTEVGPHDNFFRLGGHSLLLTQVLARVNRAFNLSLPLRHVFDAPTIAELAAVIERALVEDIKSGAADSEPSAAMAVGS
ncbi:MAG TPA: amino acid adenylation domain-containing protein, partial [Lacunisphaera sp.]|nr:amino acid adenylation domain-containing protein [Lacunisphaera sp.]